MTKPSTNIRFDGLYWGRVDAEWGFNTERMDYFLYLRLAPTGEAVLTSALTRPSDMTQPLFEERCQQGSTSRGAYNISGSSMEIETSVYWRQNLGVEERFSGGIGVDCLNLVWNYKFIQEGEVLSPFTRPLMFHFVAC